MKRLECPLCHGEGFLEDVTPGGYFDLSAECWYPLEQTRKCDLCKGAGSVEAPNHENTFNGTPKYAQLKEGMRAKRSSTNAVALTYILGVSVEDLEQNRPEQDLKRAA